MSSFYKEGRKLRSTIFKGIEWHCQKKRQMCFATTSVFSLGVKIIPSSIREKKKAFTEKLRNISTKRSQGLTIDVYGKNFVLQPIVETLKSWRLAVSDLSTIFRIVISTTIPLQWVRIPAIRNWWWTLRTRLMFEVFSSNYDVWNESVHTPLADSVMCWQNCQRSKSAK